MNCLAHPCSAIETNNDDIDNGKYRIHFYVVEHHLKNITIGMRSVTSRSVMALNVDHVRPCGVVVLQRIMCPIFGVSLALHGADTFLFLVPAMATNSNQHHSVATAGRSPLSYTSSSLRSAPGSRRERLRSFARATSQVIKQEISKYYESPPTSSDDHSSIGDTDSISSQPRPTVESTRSLPPSRPGVVRNRTQSMNDLEPSNSSSTSTITPDSGKPHCMLFPTYACKTIDHNNQTTWRVRLAGWTFALPGSSRIERWILGMMMTT